MHTHGISHDEAASLLADLVAVNSVNPSLVPGAPGEREIAHVVARWLEQTGLEIDVWDVAPGRPNVVGRVRGTGGGRSLLLNAHMDTVGVSGMSDPFVPRRAGDRLYGRGAYDMKGGLAAIMLAARAVAQQGGAAGDVYVTAVMDEEYASLGTEAVVQRVRSDGAVVTEPTGLRLCTAHKGFAWVRIETSGRAAHGSKPDKGVDAIGHMGRVLTAMEGIGKNLTERVPHELLGHGSVHASLIEGGQELSSYPATCALQIERRTIPGETPQAILAEVQGELDRLSSRDPNFSARAELFFWRDPFEIALEEPVVAAVRGAIRDIKGGDPEVYGDTPWMDAAILHAAGIPTVVFGPGGAGAHANEEYGSISEVVACAEALTLAALNFCTRQTDT